MIGEKGTAQKCIFSVFDNEQECISSILALHNDGKSIDVDPMYNKGAFYNNSVVEKPLMRFDLEADAKQYDAEVGDATNLPLKNNSVGCMILDPPFIFNPHGKAKNNSAVVRFTAFDDFEQLKKSYVSIIKEAFRVLEDKGILIFKCQDYTDSKTTMTHCLVWEWATEQGFYAKDIGIVNVTRGKKYNPNLKQKHLRKSHCYFWVFEKPKQRRKGGEG